MGEDGAHQVTRLLEEIGSGRTQAADELLPIVYSELRRLARARFARERSGDDSQPTSLVHEAYLRLVGDAEYRWENRGHFFAAAAEAMRRIVIDRARRRGRQKHGGGQRRVTFEEGSARSEPRAEDLLDLDSALDRLEDVDERMSTVVKLHYFAGLTIEETAHAMNLSPRTVTRAWTAARAWLQEQMDRP